MNPYLAAAGLGLQAYGSYNQAGQTQNQYRLAVEAWEAEQESRRRREAEERQQQLLNNVLAGGNYAQGMVRNAQSAYGSYARQVGL